MELTGATITVRMDRPIEETSMSSFFHIQGSGDLSLALAHHNHATVEAIHSLGPSIRETMRGSERAMAGVADAVRDSERTTREGFAGLEAGQAQALQYSAASYERLGQLLEVNERMAAQLESGLAQAVWQLQRSEETLQRILEEVTEPDRFKDARKARELLLQSLADGFHDDAVKAFDKLENDIFGGWPWKDFDIFRLMGWVFFRDVGDAERAVQLFERACKYARPRCPDVAWRAAAELAWVRLELERYPEALEAIDLALEILGEASMTLRVDAAEALQSVDAQLQRAAALALGSGVLRQDPQPEVPRGAGDKWWARGRPEWKGAYHALFEKRSLYAIIPKGKTRRQAISNEQARKTYQAMRDPAAAMAGVEPAWWDATSYRRRIARAELHYLRAKILARSGAESRAVVAECQKAVEAHSPVSVHFVAEPCFAGMVEEFEPVLEAALARERQAAAVLGTEIRAVVTRTRELTTRWEPVNEYRSRRGSPPWPQGAEAHTLFVRVLEVSPELRLVVHRETVVTELRQTLMLELERLEKVADYAELCSHEVGLLDARQAWQRTWMALHQGLPEFMPDLDLVLRSPLEVVVTELTPQALYLYSEFELWVLEGQALHALQTGHSEQKAELVDKIVAPLDKELERLELKIEPLVSAVQRSLKRRGGEKRSLALGGLLCLFAGLFCAGCPLFFLDDDAFATLGGRTKPYAVAIIIALAIAGVAFFFLELPGKRAQSKTNRTFLDKEIGKLKSVAGDLEPIREKCREALAQAEHFMMDETGMSDSINLLRDLDTRSTAALAAVEAALEVASPSLSGEG
jgi:tetratricopeptide (TPR) repeat protein